MSYLIAETTKEEREKIVADALGKKELRQINMEFNARYVKGDDMSGRSGCMYL